MDSERALLSPMPAQARQRHAQHRHDGRARGFDQAFGLFEYGPARQPRPRNLRHRVQKNAEMVLGEPGAVESLRPGLETIAQILHQARHAGRGLRFAPQLLEQFEHQAFDAIGRA